MNARLDDAALCQLLDEQSNKFCQAIRSLDVIEATLQTEGWSDAVHDTLQTLTRGLTSDPGCQEAFQRWNRAPQAGSPRLKAAVERARTVLKSLLERVDAVESVARRLKDRLAPQIDQGIRARDAMNAYRQASEYTHPTTNSAEPR